MKTHQVTLAKLYPECRWGNAHSPAYGTLSDYQFMRRHSTSSKRREKARQQWGESLDSIQDIIEVFVRYTSGECYNLLHKLEPLVVLMYVNQRLESCL